MTGTKLYILAKGSMRFSRTCTQYCSHCALSLSELRLMSLPEEIQGGRMKGGGREVEDRDGCSKRVRDEEPNAEGLQRQGGCSKKRRIRSENWSAKETLQMLALRKAIVETSKSKGSDAWKQIAQQLADMNPESQARSSKQVSQRWDTLVKVYVSVEEQCCDSGRTCGEVIGERQKRCKTEYRQLWHELIAQGNPGKRRPGKAAVQADEAPGSSASGASQAVATIVRKFGEIANSFSEMLDTIDRSISSSERIGNEVLGQANENIVTGSSWEPEDDEGVEATISLSGLKKQQVETKAELAAAAQAMANKMQSISEAASASESFCLEVDQKDWTMVIQRLSAITQRIQVISVQGISRYVTLATKKSKLSFPSREDIGADFCTANSQQQPLSAARSTHDHTNNSIQRSSSLTSSFYITKICRRTSLPSLNTKRSEKSCSSGKRIGDSSVSPATSTATFTGLSDIVHLSPKSDCESLSGSRWFESDRANLQRTNICATSSMEQEKKLEEKEEKKKRTEHQTSILKFRQRLALEEVGEKGSRTVSRTMTRFGPTYMEKQRNIVELVYTEVPEWS